MQRIVFASDGLPDRLDDQARFSLWRDIYTAHYGALEIFRPPDRPFSMQCTFERWGTVGLGQLEGTVNRDARTQGMIAADRSDNFCLVLNRGRSRMSSLHRGQEASLGPGAAALYSDTEVAEVRGEGENAIFALVLPRGELLGRVRNVEDLLGAPVHASHPVVQHLGRYLDILLQLDGLGDDPRLVDHVGTTLVDLIALALGAGRDVTELARMRGLRSARLKAILAEIRGGFADPAFSPDDIAGRLGVSPRYVQNLLHETGLSFTARVLELRLQRARVMLADPRHDRLKVAEIAVSCGFNEIPYFNRCFRRRFGAPPTQFRGAASS
jgi:AraC-like DNA-binding protein